MEAITMRQLKRELTVKGLSDKLPCKLTADSQTICVLLSVSQYSQLVKGYKDVDSSHNLYQPGDRYQPGERVLVKRGKRLIEVIVPELDAEGSPMW